jgi:hypothetical protein
MLCGTDNLYLQPSFREHQIYIKTNNQHYTVFNPTNRTANNKKPLAT